MSSWYIFIFGPPALIITLTVSIIGVITKCSSLVLLGAIFSTLISLHISMQTMPSLSGYLGLVIPLTLTGASLAIRYKINWLSYVLLLPLIALIVRVTIGIFAHR